MKTYCALLLCLLSVSTRSQIKTCTVIVDASNLHTRIDKNIYGQFSEHLGNCIYGGIWVGDNSAIPNTNGIRNDVVEALKRIQVPVLRWPGGCFADEYHWKDGIGPRDKRPAMINTNWGGVTEDNSFGTHEFLEFCRQVGCQPYITGNVGSGTVQEFSRWVEYVNSDNVCPMTEMRKNNGREQSWGVTYWGIGNESWGCGGNMRPEFYADQARRYGTYLREYGGKKLFKIACGPSDNDYNWTEVLMRNALGSFSGLSLHHYSFNNSRTATDFGEHDWFEILRSSLNMEELIQKHSAIMDKYDPHKRIALIVDEWGTWYAVEPGTNPGFLYQQNTLRDAVAAACNLNIFNNHCDRVRMANIAQMINVLQAMILTKGDRMVCTPTYYVFEMYRAHQNALWVKTAVQSPEYVLGNQKLPAVNASASVDDHGKLHISLCNIDPHALQHVTCDLHKFQATSVTGTILTAAEMNEHNTFEKPNAVTLQPFSGATLEKNAVEVNLPAKSVVLLELTGTCDLSPAVELKNPTLGLQYKYYEGHWSHLPSFDTLTAKRTDIIEQINIPDQNSGEDFAVRYTGYIMIPADGSYTFFANSDDGSFVSLDDNLVVDNDGQHAPLEQSGMVVLKKGFHKISVEFFQAGGRKELTVSMEGPAFQKQVIPAALLFHE